MTQKRDLVPLTVYLSPTTKARAEKIAAEKGLAVATLLRLVLTGEMPPLLDK